MHIKESRTTVTASVERKGEEPLSAVLEDGGALGGDADDVDVVYETHFDIGRKVFGNGIGVQVRTQNLTDGSREARDAAFDENLKQFEEALRRNKAPLQKFLRAALREVADGSTWDPTGDDLPAPVRPAPVPTTMPLPVTTAGGIPVARRPGT